MIQAALQKLNWNHHILNFNMSAWTDSRHIRTKNRMRASAALNNGLYQRMMAFERKCYRKLLRIG